MNATASLEIRFETTVCARCGGTGRYSFNLMDMDRCYGCGGRKRALTKAGAAAREAYDALINERCTKPAEDLKAGDKVWRQGGAPVFGIPAMFRRSGWYELVAIDRKPGSASWTLDFGPDQDGSPRVMDAQPGERFRVPNREAVRQTMREVAAKYKGATLISGEGDEIAADAEQAARDAKQAAARERRQQKAAEKRAAEQAKRDRERLAERDAWRRANPELAAYLDAVEPTHEMDERRGPALWIAEIAARAENFALSDKEAARLRQLMAQKAKEDAERAASRHFGTVGARETFTATLVSCRNIGKDFNNRTKYLAIMTEASGAKLKSFTTGSWVYDIEDGDTFTATAIIDKHGEYRGELETVVKDIRIRKAK